MTEISRPFGRFFEDFVVGDVYLHWPGKTITRAEDMLFTTMTLTNHPLHLDDNYASRVTASGRPIVVGTLVYSVIFGQSIPDVSGRAITTLEVESVMHPNSAFHGDTLYSESEVLEVRPSSSKPDRGIVRVRTTGYNQDGVIVCTFIRKVLVPRKGFGFEGHLGRPRPQWPPD